MGIEYASIVDHPLDEVFAWHTRTGAMRRLVPPWQPMRVIKETESLADGTAILGLPGGLRWVARHDPAGYHPPNQFVDVLSSDGLMTMPPRVIGWWRHTHRFSEDGPGKTRMLDEVDTTVPGAALRSTFAYRHRQLAEDLAAHRDAAAAGAGQLVIAITGSSGLVGTALAAFLSTGGHRVIRLVRGAPANESERRWDPDNPAPDLLSGVDALVHLAGESIAGRFTESHRRAIRESRIGPTRRLAGPVNAVAPNPVRNADYTRALASTLKRPALLPVPSFGPRVLLGRQGAVELAEADQRVAPAALQALGHRFRQPTVEDALAHQLGHDPAPGVL
jgi:ligand-binding SRPBCC domain-containing protein/uncharacterized protein YbjT (DUF2867 family)